MNDKLIKAAEIIDKGFYKTDIILSDKYIPCEITEGIKILQKYIPDTRIETFILSNEKWIYIRINHNLHDYIESGIDDSDLELLGACNWVTNLSDIEDEIENEESMVEDLCDIKDSKIKLEYLKRCVPEFIK